MADLPPVLLVHGFASSLDHGWRQGGWLDLLADAGRQVIGIDMPAHGPGPHSHDPADYAGAEDVVLAAIDGHEQVDAVGFSMGARVVLTLASQHPQRFRKLVAMGVGANLFRTEPAEGDPANLAAILEAGEAPADDMMGQLFVRLAETTGNDRLALAAFLRRSGPILTQEALANITCPVLVAIGDKDFAGPPDPLVDALPDAKLLLLKGVDHFSAPQNFTAIDGVLTFIDASI
jgi:pimeloyl-ACP methyl ester carboxylesterase